MTFFLFILFLVKFFEYFSVFSTLEKWSYLLSLSLVIYLARTVAADVV